MELKKDAISLNSVIVYSIFRGRAGHVHRRIHGVHNGRSRPGGPPGLSHRYGRGRPHLRELFPAERTIQFGGGNLLLYPPRLRTRDGMVGRLDLYRHHLHRRLRRRDIRDLPLQSVHGRFPLWLGIVIIAIPTFYVGWKGIQLTTKGLVVLWLVQTALMVWPAISAFNSQAPAMPDVGKQVFAASWIPTLGSKGLAVAVLLCIWSYVGFETPAYLGEEIKGGSKAVKIAIPVGSIAIGITYIVVTWLWVSSISAENLAKISGSGTAISDYCSLIGYPLGRWLITISVCMSCLACWFSFVTAPAKDAVRHGQDQSPSQKLREIEPSLRAERRPCCYHGPVDGRGPFWGIFFGRYAFLPHVVLRLHRLCPRLRGGDKGQMGGQGSQVLLRRQGDSRTGHRHNVVDAFLDESRLPHRRPAPGLSSASLSSFSSRPRKGRDFFKRVEL